MDDDNQQARTDRGVQDQGDVREPVDGRPGTGDAAFSSPRGAVRQRLKARWSRLSEADLAIIDKHPEALPGLLVERHGLARHQSEMDSKAFFGKALPLDGEPGALD